MVGLTAAARFPGPTFVDRAFVGDDHHPVTYPPRAGPCPWHRSGVQARSGGCKQRRPTEPPGPAAGPDHEERDGPTGLPATGHRGRRRGRRAAPPGHGHRRCPDRHPRREPLRAARHRARRERPAAPGGLHVTRRGRSGRAGGRHRLRLARLPRRRGHLPHRRRRLDPRVQQRGLLVHGARRRGGERGPLRQGRRDRRRLPDPRGQQLQLRRRPHPVGHVAVGRGELRGEGPGVGVRSHRREGRRGPRGHGPVRPRGGGGRRGHRDALPHPGPPHRAVLPLHAHGLPRPVRRAPGGGHRGRRRRRDVDRGPRPVGCQCAHPGAGARGHALQRG